MAENKSDELTESAEVDSPETSKSDLGQYLSNNRGMGAVAQPSAIERALESFNSHQLAINSAMASIAQPSAIERALESFSAHQLAINSAMASIAQPSAIERALESFSAHQLAINSAMASIAQPSAIERALESFSAHQLAINSAMASIANFPAIENTLASFASASSMILRDPSSLSAILASIETSKFSSFELDNLEADLTTAADQFNSAGSLASLASVFTNLPPPVQAIFLFILLHVFLPQVNSISANLLTPVVESYLQDNNSTNREKVKEIKEIPAHLNDVTTEGLRFITGNNVRLRSKPSTKSEILDELILGQVVTILSKDRNWIEVTYTYGDGETMSGWVFTRYTAKFIR